MDDFNGGTPMTQETSIWQHDWIFSKPLLFLHLLQEFCRHLPLPSLGARADGGVEADAVATKPLPWAFPRNGGTPVKIIHL